MDNEIILDKFSNRLFKLIKENDMDINIIANKLGLKSKSTIYRYMNGHMAPKVTTVKYLAEFFNVNPVWLMGYDVPMQKQTRINNNIQGIDKSTEKGAVVFVYGTIPAGTPIECIEDIIDTEEISIDMLKGGKEYFGLRVKGNSMEPEYLNGDTLILLKQDDCENGDDCVVMVNGQEGTFKRVFKNKNGIILQPLNNAYTPISYTNKEIEELPVRILGVVEEIRRKKRQKNNCNL